MNISPTILFRLTYQHEAINGIIASKTKERLHHFPAPGKWSIHDNIVHLAKYQPIFIERVHKILKENTPEFGRYRAEDDVEFETWRAWDTVKLLERIKQDRGKIVDLATSLDENQVMRIGIHKKFGELSFEMWLEFFLLHEAHHIYTMFQLANDVEIKTT